MDDITEHSALPLDVVQVSSLGPERSSYFLVQCFNLMLNCSRCNVAGPACCASWSPVLGLGWDSTFEQIADLRGLQLNVWIA